jgi:hypothetical protein
MVEPGEVIIALGAFTAVGVSIKVVVSGILTWQENKLKHLSPGIGSAAEARLERMEQAVDAIAIEIERISEGQRFTTRLLSDRATTSR